MIKRKQVQQWKLDEVNNLVVLFREYKNVIIIDASKINDKQIQQMRKVLRGKAVLRMAKKSLQFRAIEQYKNEFNKENIQELTKHVLGQSGLLFTNMDAFEVKNLFEKNKWMIPAKPDEDTPVDIWVPAGDTGLPTGQVISELNVTLKLPTMIRNDTIWVREDKMTHKAGDVVSVKEAAVLKKLGVRPIESLLKIHFAWCDGEIIPADVLYMDIEQFQKDVASSYITARTLALELGIVDEETITPLIQKVWREATSLLFETSIFVEDATEEYIRKAVAAATTLNTMIFRESMSSQAVDEPKKLKKDEKEEKKEESVGIGGLFS